MTKKTKPEQATATPGPNDKTENTPPVSSYSRNVYNETKTDKKGTTTTVEVEQVVDTDYNSTIITAEKTNKEGTKKDTIREHTIKTYDTSSGYTETNKISSKSVTYSKKQHYITEEIRNNYQAYTNQSGALAQARGFTGTKHHATSETTINHLDKKGNFTHQEYHYKDTETETRIDTVSEYSRSKKDELKKQMRITATAAKIGISNTSPKRIFSATITPTGEHYNSTKGNSSIDIKIGSDGQISGQKFVYTDNKHETKELSHRQLNKELRKAREQADKTIKQVTEAKNLQELTDNIPSPLNIGRTMSLGETFNRGNAEVYAQSTEKLAKDYQQRQEQDKLSTLDADTIIHQKMRLLDEH
jgi:hypothetical protein